MDGTFAVTLRKQTVWGARAAPAGSAARKETKDKIPQARKLPCGHWHTQPTGPEPFLPKCWVRLAEPQEDPPLLGETLSQPQKGHPSSCSGTASAWEGAVHLFARPSETGPCSCCSQTLLPPCSVLQIPGMDEESPQRCCFSGTCFQICDSVEIQPFSSD